MLVSIIGGVLAVGLGILIALKVIIMIIERIEYEKFKKDLPSWGVRKFALNINGKLK